MVSHVVHDEQVRVSFVRDRRGPCSWILNVLWLVVGGWHMFLAWFIIGMLLCVSLVGIPCGLQVLKIACFLLFPFGKTVTCPPLQDAHCGGCNCCCNVLWVITVGWILALQQIGTGILLCMSIVGIPFGWQCFKLAYICFWPFGLDVSSELVETVTVQNTRYEILEDGVASVATVGSGGSKGGTW